MWAKEKHIGQCPMFLKMGDGPIKMVLSTKNNKLGVNVVWVFVFKNNLES
jgi:hypothetical protein